MLMKKQHWRSKHYILNNIFKYARNLVKLFLRPLKYYPIDWSIGQHLIVSTPTDPKIIDAYLTELSNVEYACYGVLWKHSNTLKKISDDSQKKQYDRLVYVISKDN
jgi:hypothetical protein